MTVLESKPAEPGIVAEPSPEERQRALTWTIGAIVAIWASVAAISIWAPDMVSGAPNTVTGEQEHIAIAAILTWIWGLIASRNVATTIIKRRHKPAVATNARLLALVTIPVWGIAAVVAIWGPVMVTGSDPTRLPIAAIIAPIAAMVITGVVAQLLTAFESDERS